MKCIIKDCKNYSHQGEFKGNLCSPYFLWLSTRRKEYQNSQAFINEINASGNKCKTCKETK